MDVPVFVAPPGEVLNSGAFSPGGGGNSAPNCEFGYKLQAVLTSPARANIATVS